MMCNSLKWFELLWLPWCFQHECPFFIRCFGKAPSSHGELLLRAINLQGSAGLGPCLRPGQRLNAAWHGPGVYTHQIYQIMFDPIRQISIISDTHSKPFSIGSIHFGIDIIGVGFGNLRC